jgi:hypothetical protein
VKKKIGLNKAPSKTASVTTSKISNKIIKKNVIKRIKSSVKLLPVSSRIGPAKTKNLLDKTYIRIAEDESLEEYNKLSKLIQEKKIQWAYLAFDTEENKNFHYYFKL